jgi:tetratricopeptide (TPR) repeat protein
MEKDFYSILGVERNASTDQIRRRFLDLTREKHPDRFRGDAKEAAEHEFQDITQAFNVLSNPNLRREHDQSLVRPKGDGTGADPGQLLRAYLQRGARAYKARNAVEAADNFRRATETDPRSALAWHHLARACHGVPRYLPQACEAISKACELEPMKVSYQQLAGQIHADAGRRDDALRYYRMALKWGGDDPVIVRAIEELESGKKKSLLGGIFGKMDR